jgi:hypothetical protein
MTEQTHFKVTAMKYPGFYATAEVKAEHLDQAITAAKLLAWDDGGFVPTSDWPPVQSLLVESEDDSRLVDLEPSLTAAVIVLRELVDDVKLAHGTGEGDAIDGAGLDWPDLAETYWKAVAVLNNQASVFRQNVFVATYEHKHGTDIRVFQTQTQAEAWRREVADMWWDEEFDDFPRPSDPNIDIGEVYFERMRDRGEEFFSIEATPVE